MELQIQGKSMPLTDAIRSYATDKFHRLATRFGRAMTIQLWLGAETREAKNKQAAASIHVKGKELRLESKNENLYAAIDELAESCAQALTREKEKRSRRRWKAMAAKEARRAGLTEETGLRGAALAGQEASEDQVEAQIALEDPELIEAPWAREPQVA
jgi:putative sigma-54 modulation protein